MPFLRNEFSKILENIFTMTLFTWQLLITNEKLKIKAWPEVSNILELIRSKVFFRKLLKQKRDARIPSDSAGVKWSTASIGYNLQLNPNFLCDRESSNWSPRVKIKIGVNFAKSRNKNIFYMWQKHLLGVKIIFFWKTNLCVAGLR